MLSDEAMHERMAKGWRGGLTDGTVCGNGSTMQNTRNAREWLPRICAALDIKTVCDAGAGDLHWIKRVDWQVDYRAFDLIPRLPEITQIDITRDVLPPCDLILCRMVLNHLDEPRICMALENFRESGKYLAATHFAGDELPKRSPQFTRLDLRHAPYNLGEPLSMVQDGAEDICKLALWRL